MHLIVRSSILILLAGALFASLGAPAVIGTAAASGDFYLDKAAVRGNATVLDGALLETVAAPSLVRLERGVQMRLGSGSRARVFVDRLVLERGIGEVAGARGVRLEAGSLRIVPDANGSAAKVSMGSPGNVTVAAVSGNWRVTTAEGILLARLETGSALEFQPQAAGASAPMSLKGCVSHATDHYLLHAEDVNLSFELRGKELAQYDGHRVTASATALNNEKPAPGASQVLQVAQIKSLGAGCGSPSAPGASGSTGSASGSVARGRTKAVIAGVAIAAVAGGTTLGLTRSEDSRPPISR